jgi:predicted nucleic acid-binding Zn ribbon protein
VTADVPRRGAEFVKVRPVSLAGVPTYVYKFVDTGETIEVQQSFNDPTLTETAHPVTGETMPVKKVFLPVGVTFRGDGFYKTDSRSASKKSSGNGESSSTSTEPSGAASSSTTSDGGTKAASDSSSGSSASTAPSST